MKSSYILYIFCILLLLLSSIQVVSAEGGYVYSTQWGSYCSSGYGAYTYFNPTGVAMDSAGNVYVIDLGHTQVQKFTSTGTLITQWDGQFSAGGARGIAVDGAGNVYVADAYNCQIQKFTSDGTFITKWGWGFSSEDGAFSYPYGIAVDSKGYVYVVDGFLLDTYRVQKFTSDGHFVTKWSCGDFPPGSSCYGIAVHRDENNPSTENVYVTIIGNSPCVEKFTTDGTPITQWGSRGSGDGQFNDPRGIAVDNSGNVYVSDYSDNRVQKFRSDGTFITQWGSTGSGNGQFNGPSGVAIDNAGNVYVTGDRIQKFTSTGTFLAVWAGSGSVPGQFSNPQGITGDSAGNVYVADSGNNRIQKFTSTGTYLTQWGSPLYGSGVGQFEYPSGIVVDSAGNVYVADTNNDRIQKYTSSGTFITQWGGEGTGDGQFNEPSAIAVDNAGNVYVTEERNNRVQKFNSAGTYITQWGALGSGIGKFWTPRGIAVDSAGNVYVADSNNCRIQKFTSDGTFVMTFGSYGSGDGQFWGPHGIAVDGAGNVYVADLSNNRIQKFTSTGTFLTKWGSPGSGDGQFNGPWGITVDSVGNVYVADMSNNRIQKFAPILAASFTATPTAGTAPLTVAFTDASTGTGPLTYAWDFDSDGTVDSTERNPSHTYTSAGSYTVTLTVTNIAGSDSEIKTAYVTVNPAPVAPVAAFTATPTTGTAPLTVAFTDQSTGMPGSWSWTFGDGTTSTQQNPDHIYSGPGDYPVSLVVSNAAGTDQVEKTGYIHVTGLALPVAAFSYIPETTISVNDLVTFSSDSTGRIDTYIWSFGDGTPDSNEMTAMHQYAAPGTYTVQLTVSNNRGSATTSQTVTVVPTSQVAGFSADVMSGTAPLAVQFTDQSTGAPTSWSWSFGDGGTSTLQGPTHTYAAAGTYDVTLTVTDGTGLIATVTHSVTVTLANQAPVVAAGDDAAGSEGTPVAFSGTYTDPGDTGAHTIAWAFGDGSTASDLVTTHTYADNGAYTATLTVTDAGDLTASDTLTVTVANAPPVVEAGDDTSATTGSPVTFAGSFTDAGTADSYTFAWAFGDGTSATEQNPTHAYATAGTYTAILTVTDDDGGAGTDSVTVVVSDPPVAAFTTTPTYLSVAFTDTSTGTAPLTYAWDFGDSGTSTLPSPTHFYATAGTYTVKLTVTGPGGSDDVTQTVTVTAPPVAPVAGFTSIPTYLSVAFTDTSTGTAPLTYLWDFGDGATSTVQSPTHVYAAAGTYTVKLTVTGPGGSDDVTQTVTATAPPVAPVAAFTATPTYLSVAFTGTSTGTAPLTYLWDFGDGATSTDQSPTHVYAVAGPYTVKLTVTGPGGNDEVTQQVTVSAPPVAPVAAFTATPTYLSVAFTDTSTGTAPLAYAWDFGDSGTSTLPSPTHVYAAAGTYTVKLTVTGPGGVNAVTKSVTVTALPAGPSAEAGGPYTGVEGTGVAFSATGSTGTGLLTFAWDLDNDSQYDDCATSSASKMWNDGPVTATIGLRVTDANGQYSTDTATVTVANAAPVVTGVTVPANPVAVGTSVAATATFTDAGTADTHTARWTWGDGATTAGTITGATVSGTHAYTSAGMFNVTVTVTDDDGGAGTGTAQTFVVAYDPNGGFVTGGGWIQSPAGAYVADPGLTGKATFSFESKYQKGASVPTGKVQLKINEAGFTFQSTSYQWLAIAGAKAQYKGTGTINGAGNYDFMLTAVDGDVNGKGKPDLFRLKIWDRGTGGIVYDNKMNAPDTNDPTTVLGGGSIVIHKG